MKSSSFLKAFALDLCAAAIGVSVVALPMLFLNALT
jgi:hypothetical protein